MRLCLTLLLLLLLPTTGEAYFRLQGQVSAPTPVLKVGRRVPMAETELQRFRRQILELTNAERQKKNLPPLTKNAILERTAQAHAEDMRAKNYFSHKNGQGKEPSARIRDAGYFVIPCTACAYSFSSGENIAKGQRTAKSVMQAWMNSPVHRDNILRANFRELGVGYTGDIWVQNFGAMEIK